jgi:hypothetical protein
MLFEKSSKVCAAFEYAKFQVQIVHGEEESCIFKLLLADDLNSDSKKHKNCDPFGPFVKGRYKLVGCEDAPLKYTCPIETKLKGR